MADIFERLERAEERKRKREQDLFDRIDNLKLPPVKTLQRPEVSPPPGQPSAPISPGDLFDKLAAQAPGIPTRRQARNVAAGAFKGMQELAPFFPTLPKEAPRVLGSIAETLRPEDQSILEQAFTGFLPQEEIREDIAGLLGPTPRQIEARAFNTGEVSIPDILSRIGAEMVAGFVPLTPVQAGLLIGTPPTTKLVSQAFPLKVGQAFNDFVTTKSIKIKVPTEKLKQFYIHGQKNLTPDEFQGLLKIPPEEIITAIRKGENIVLRIKKPRFGKGKAKAEVVLRSTINPESIGEKGVVYLQDKFPTFSQNVQGQTFPLSNKELNEITSRAAGAGESALIQGATPKEADIAAMQKFNEEIRPVLEKKKADRAAELAKIEAEALEKAERLRGPEQGLLPTKEELAEVVSEFEEPGDIFDVIEQKQPEGDIFDAIEPVEGDIFDAIEAEPKPKKVSQKEIETEARELQEQELERLGFNTDLEKFILAKGGLKQNPKDATGKIPEKEEFDVNVPERLRTKKKVVITDKGIPLELGRTVDQMQDAAIEAGLLQPGQSLLDETAKLPRGSKPEILDFISDVIESIEAAGDIPARPKLTSEIGKAAEKGAGIRRDEPKVLTEVKALALRFQQQARGAKFQKADIKRLQGELVKIIRDRIPGPSQKLFLSKIRDATTEKKFQAALDFVEEVANRKIFQSRRRGPQLVGDTKSRNIPDSIYDEALFVGQKGFFEKGKEDFKKVLRQAALLTDETLGILSTRLKNIDPSLKARIRKFEFDIRIKAKRDADGVLPFVKGSKKMSSGDKIIFDLARKNGDAVRINALAKKYNMEQTLPAFRKILDDLHKRARDVGFEIGYLENFHPRIIKDFKGFIEYFQKDKPVWTIIENAINQKEASLGRTIDEAEKAYLINSMIRGFTRGKITIAHTGAMKERMIDFIDANLNRFYADSNSALSGYITQVNEAIEARKFFGKGANLTNDPSGEIQLNNLNDSIGAFTLRLINDGKITPDQEVVLTNMLRARFAFQQTNPIIGLYKNITYIDTLGSPISAITQLEDLSVAFYKSLVHAPGSFIRSFFNKSKIKMDDLGVENIWEEIRENRKSSTVLRLLFKVTGFKKMDQMGKETVVNATIDKFRSRAKKKDTSSLVKELQPTYGKDTAQLILDLKSGEKTDNVLMLAFNELLDVQPVALSEMPERYLDSPRGRVFFTLKTFMIKRLDFIRNEFIQKMASPDLKTKVEGATNMLRFLTIVAVFGAGIDEIKNLILNRETTWSDRIVNNLLKPFGLSKWFLYKARREGIGKALLLNILPPVKFIDSIWKDVTINLPGGKKTEIPASIPIFGKLYFWWFGRGAERSAKARRKGQKKTKSKLKTLGGFKKLKTL